MSRHKLFRELHRELHDIQTPSEMVQHQREFLEFAREVLREKEKKMERELDRVEGERRTAVREKGEAEKEN